MTVELLESVALHRECAGPFTLPRAVVSPAAAALLEPFWRSAERVLGLSELNRLYAQAAVRPETHVADRMLGALDVSIEAHGDLRPLRDAGRSSSSPIIRSARSTGSCWRRSWRGNETTCGCSPISCS